MKVCIPNSVINTNSGHIVIHLAELELLSYIHEILLVLSYCMQMDHLRSVRVHALVWGDGYFLRAVQVRLVQRCPKSGSWFQSWSVDKFYLTCVFSLVMYVRWPIRCFFFPFLKFTFIHTVLRRLTIHFSFLFKERSHIL